METMESSVISSIPSISSISSISYKICLLGKDNNVKEIIVFSGENTENTSEIVFSEKELEFIETNQIPVKTIKQRIHTDDSISTIKNKIVKELDFSVSYYELYLFSHIHAPPKNIETVFASLSGKNEYITENILKQLFINLDISDESVLTKIKESHDGDKYFLEDLLFLQNELSIFSASANTIGISIGKHFHKTHDELFSVNPFHIYSTTPIQNLPTNPLESFENQLLLNNNGAKFIDNIIYVCFAEDVLQYATENDLNTEIVTSLYFPFLKNNDITDKETLQTEREHLVQLSKKMASTRAFEQYKYVDMMYDVFNAQVTPLPYVSSGIDIFSIKMRSDKNYILPLDTIFKNIHSSKTIPFIKYNPGMYLENIYRLYSEAITKYGTKIPVLKSTTILKLKKEMGIKKKQISFSVENSVGDFYMDIHTNGDVYVSGNNFKQPIPFDKLDEVIRGVVNPVISYINDFMRKNSYEIQLFDNVRQKSVEVEYLKFSFSLKINTKFNVLEYKHCMSPVFEMFGRATSSGHTSVIDGTNADIYRGVEMRFKRVENYRILDEQYIFIKELYQNRYSDIQIMRELSEKYGLDDEAAFSKYDDFIKENEKLNGVIAVDSPGLLVYMKMISSFDDILKIEVDNTNTKMYMEYVDVIQIYIDSLLRITQNINVPEYVDAMCRRAKNILKPSEPVSRLPKSAETYMLGNVVMGVEPEIEDIMFEEQEEEEPVDFSASHTKATVFGDDYENAELSEIEDIEEYENDEDFKELSPIQSSPSSDSGSGNDSSSGNEPDESLESLSPIGVSKEEPDESLESLSPIGVSKEPEETLSPIPSSPSATESAEKDSSSDLMYYEEEEEEEEESPKSVRKGGDYNIDGMRLENIFLNRLKEREPTLFVTEDEDNKMDAYSTLCQANQQRQPVILSQQEKDRIDANDQENQSKSYKHAIEFGSDPNKKFWYICPRYWCLKTNSAISEKEVIEGKCGGIIPKGSKTVPKGKYVYEFNHPRQHKNADGTYRDNTPGFLKTRCLPCCFKKEWKDQVTRYNECTKTTQTEEEAAAAAADMSKKPRQKLNKKEDYIIEFNRYPIEAQRMGFLPMSVQLLLQTDNMQSVNPNNRKYLNPEKTTQTLLRYGVEKSNKKSFVGCIADIYAYKNKLTASPTIQEMCDIIAGAITLDAYMKYHNGSLVSIFRPKKYNLEDIDYSKYENTEIHKTLDTSNELHMEFLSNLIASYENFGQFLKNENSYIDHTYLWDIVCLPNPMLFKTGCNLAILHIVNKDITDNIDIICPSSAYSTTLYDIRKETVFILKQDEYYEPIYLFINEVNAAKNKRKLMVQKTFLEKKSTAFQNIHAILQTIRNSIQNYCPPKYSMPRKYTFKRNMNAENLYTLISKFNLDFVCQVLNYQGKVIGMFIRFKRIENAGVVLPCYPSSMLPNLPMRYMDDNSLWQLDYRTTVKILKEIKKKSKGAILCDPVLKIVEDGLVIGVLTETNQFIMISSPTENIEDEIPAITDENYLMVDKSGPTDEVREKTVKMITLETQFYTSFRTTVRYLLNQFSNKAVKNKIIEIIENPRYLHKYKLKKIQEILHQICDPYVSFTTYDDTTLLRMGEITDCIVDAKNKVFCMTPAAETDDVTPILLPEKHLLSGFDNRKIYFSRVADELVRYKRIQTFMLNTNVYLNITNTEYKVNEDEIIMLESLLTPEYLNSLEPYEYGKNVQLTYENATPIHTQTYNNEISREAQEQMIIKDTNVVEIQEKMKYECIEMVYPVIGSGTSQWKNFFPKNTMEMQLIQSIKCSFYPILYVYNKVYNTMLTAEQLKEMLAEEYSKYFENEMVKTRVFDLWIKQGKKEMVKRITTGKNTWETLVAAELYYLTNIDIWILANKLKLPMILFSTKPLRTLVETVNWLKLGDTDMESSISEEYYFVRSPINQHTNVLPHYTIIQTPLKSTSDEMIKLLSDASPENTVSLNSILGFESDNMQ